VSSAVTGTRQTPMTSIAEVKTPAVLNTATGLNAIDKIYKTHV